MNKTLRMLLLGMVIASLPFAAQAKDIKIGASLPLTGNFAIPGQKHKDGYELCVDLINQKGGILGRKVDLLVSDNRSDTDTSISQLERFLNVDKVDLLFGTFSSKLTFPTSNIAEKAGMVYPVPSGGALKIWERGYKNMFYFQVNAAEYIGETPVQLVQMMTEGKDRPRTAAVVYADDFFAKSIAAGLLGEDVKLGKGKKPIKLSPGFLAKAGIKVNFSQKWPGEGFDDWITLANSIKGSGAEFLVGLAASPEDAVQLVRALKTVGYDPKGIYLSQGTQEEFKEGLGSAANGILIHSAWHPAAKWEGLLAGKKFTNLDFQREFKKKFNHPPDEDEAVTFAVCQGIEQGVRGAGSTDNQAVRNWLSARTKEHPVKTVLGNFNWDKRGLPIGRPFLVLQWQKGVLEFVHPRDEFPGTKPMIWPKPRW